MNLQIGRDQKVESLGVVPVKLSEQMAYHMAPLLEVLGISSIHLRRDESIGGPVFSVAESDFFTDVPPEILKWAEPALNAIGALMSSFGIMSMAITTDEGDKSGLADVWSSMLPVSTRPEDKLTDGVRSWGVSDTSSSIEVDEPATPATPAAPDPAVDESSNDSEVLVL